MTANKDICIICPFQLKLPRTSALQMPSMIITAIQKSLSKNTRHC